MKRLLLILPFLFFSTLLSAQIDGSDSLSVLIAYEKGLNFTEKQVDSIAWYADFADRIWTKSHYPPARMYSLRLYGFYYENKADYRRAIDYYLQTLDESRRINNREMQIHSLTDLTVMYTEMKQPRKALDTYLECVQLRKASADSSTLVTSLINLGPLYNKVGLHDSALFILQEGLRYGKPLEDRGVEDLSNLYNNLGQTYYYLGNYDMALFYFKGNYRRHLKAGSDLTAKATQWFDVLNMADAFTRQGVSMDSAQLYAYKALDLATQLNSRSKISDSYGILSKMAYGKHDFKMAYDYQTRWYNLDTALVNGETYKAIAELEERYEARQRENENLRLAGEVAQEKFHNRIILMMAGFMLVIAVIAGLAFVVKRKVNRQLQATNDLVVRQNERLSELNYEKNSLISIVSHDLSTPFASIGMWAQLLQSDTSNLHPDQVKALRRIEQATGYGEKLIRHILDVEKAETNQHKVQLENLDLSEFAETMVEGFRPTAMKKNVGLHLDTPDRPVLILSDRQLLTRMVDNLLSNAVKYTAPGKQVWMTVSEEKDRISIRLRDEGVGIEADELPRLFSKYSKISTQPTNGEPSTGLGLSIVKRICEELNGEIGCESVVGEGSVFTVVFKK